MTQTAEPIGSVAKPVTEPAARYQMVDGRPLVMNAYGLPRAQPLFSTLEFPLNGIRGYPDVRGPCETCLCTAGPAVPDHWWDAGTGWVTNYFTSLQPYNLDKKQKGVFQCNVPLPDGRPCNFVVENTACCESNCCFTAGRNAPMLMKKHLKEAHGFKSPPKREWATGLCETTGCGDVIFCTPCHGSRQMMALLGHIDTWNVWWCLYLCIAGCQSSDSENDQGNKEKQCIWVPPWQTAALLTRWQIVQLNNVDENCCCTGIKSVLCPCCSLAQSYRELSASGVWPGGTCCSNAPPAVSLKPAVIAK